MSLLASSPKASRKPEVLSSPKGSKKLVDMTAVMLDRLSTLHKKPPFRQMTTTEIYRMIAGKGPFKWKAVRDIFIEVMLEAMKQANHTGSFELAAMLRIKVDTISCKRGKASKKIVKAMPSRWMRELATRH